MDNWTIMDKIASVNLWLAENRHIYKMSCFFEYFPNGLDSLSIFLEAQANTLWAPPKLSLLYVWLPGRSSRDCFPPPRARPRYMAMTSARRWSVSGRTWACARSTMCSLTSWLLRSTCGSTHAWRAWLKRTSEKRWISKSSPPLSTLPWELNM